MKKFIRLHIIIIIHMVLQTFTQVYERTPKGERKSIDVMTDLISDKKDSMYVSAKIELYNFEKALHLNG